MTDLRAAALALVATVLAACSSSPSERTKDAELAALAPFKQQYSELVAGFEIRPARTLIVSVNLQNYIEADDARIAAMKRDAVARWRNAWKAQHPHEQATLFVRFIDFIGRKVATEKTNV